MPPFPPPTHTPSLCLLLKWPPPPPPPHIPTKLESHKQIKQVKSCLEELYKSIVRLEAAKTVSKALASGYKDQVKQLLYQAAADGYELHGAKAEQQEKLKLAIHHYQIALNVLTKNNQAGQFKARIEDISKIIKAVQEKLNIIDDQTSDQEMIEQANSAEWEKTVSGDDLWKKKTVYD